MDFDQNPPDDALAASQRSAGSGMETSTAEPPAHGSVFAVPLTPFAPPATLEDGAPTAPVAAPPFVDPWADAGAGDPMLGGEDVLRAPRAPSPAPMDALPSAKALTPPARAPMALTPPVAPTAPMDAAPTAASAPMALTPPAPPMALTPPAPRAASDATAPPAVVVATAPAATKGKRVKRQTIGPGAPEPTGGGVARAAESSDDDFEMGETLSEEERARRAKAKAEREGNVHDISDDSVAAGLDASALSSSSDFESSSDSDDDSDPDFEEASKEEDPF